jgi:hypothetical protein
MQSVQEGGSPQSLGIIGMALASHAGEHASLTSERMGMGRNNRKRVMNYCNFDGK